MCDIKMFDIFADIGRFFLIFLLGFIAMLAVAVAPAKQKISVIVFMVLVILFVWYYEPIVGFLANLWGSV